MDDDQSSESHNSELEEDTGVGSWMPKTDQVRIIGAVEASKAMKAGTDGEDVSSSTVDDTREDIPEQESLSQHWSDPPTGQVPLILRQNDDEEGFNDFVKNTVSWRGQSDRRVESEDDLSDLAEDYERSQENSNFESDASDDEDSDEERDKPFVDDNGRMMPVRRRSKGRHSKNKDLEDKKLNATQNSFDYEDETNVPSLNDDVDGHPLNAGQFDDQLPDGEEKTRRGRWKSKSNARGSMGDISNELDKEPDDGVDNDLTDDFDDDFDDDEPIFKFSRRRNRRKELLDSEVIPVPDDESLTIGGGSKINEVDIKSAKVSNNFLERNRVKSMEGSDFASEADVDSGNRKDLSTRIVTGSLFAAIAVVIFAIGSQTALVFVLVVATLAVGECYSSFRKVRFKPPTVLGVVATPSIIVAAYLKGSDGAFLILGLFVVATTVWYLSAYGTKDSSERPVANIGVTFLGFMWVAVLASFAGLILNPNLFPHGHGVAYLATAITLSVANDVGGYIGGRLAGAGGHLLAPFVSPKKTWEGFMGGIVMTMLLSMIIGNTLHPWTLDQVLVLGAVVSVVSPLGDLVESMIKRDLRIKDFGTLLPGHGGILDRVDGILFTLPAAFAVLSMFHLS